MHIDSPVDVLPYAPERKPSEVVKFLKRIPHFMKEHSRISLLVALANVFGGHEFARNVAWSPPEIYVNSSIEKRKDLRLGQYGETGLGNTLRYFGSSDLADKADRFYGDKTYGPSNRAGLIVLTPLILGLCGKLTEQRRKENEQ